MLTTVRVETPEHVELLRLIRNAAHGTFSHDNEVISKQAQRAWWVAMKGRVKAWLYYDVPDLTIQKTRALYGIRAIHTVLIGYGLLRQTDDGKWWNSIAVRPGFLGRGYGSFITFDLLTKHEGQVYATVRSDNLPAIAMHHESDWERVYANPVDYATQVRTDDPLVYFRSKPR